MPDFNRIVSEQGRLKEQVLNIAKPYSQTAYPCKVVAVHEYATNILVDVDPLIQQLTTTGEPIATKTIYGLLVQRIQMGLCAIIIKPKIGDIGTAKICHSDISGFKSNGGNKSPPLNNQPNSYSNAIFEIGQTFSDAATTYITVEDDKVTVHSKDAVFECDTVTVNNDFVVKGKSNLQGDVKTDAAITNQNKNIGFDSTHIGVQPGSGVSGVVS